MSIIFSLGSFLACCAIFGIAELSLAQQAQPLFTIEQPNQRCPHPEGQFSLEEVHQIQHIIQRLIERLAMLAHHIQNKRIRWKEALAIPKRLKIKMTTIQR